jgi:hypothetical protein
MIGCSGKMFCWRDLLAEAMHEQGLRLAEKPAGDDEHVNETEGVML